MLRVVIVDETGSVQGLAFDSVAEKLDLQLKVEILITQHLRNTLFSFMFYIEEVYKF